MQVPLAQGGSAIVRNAITTEREPHIGVRGKKGSKILQERRGMGEMLSNVNFNVEILQYVLIILVVVGWHYFLIIKLCVN